MKKTFLFTSIILLLFTSNIFAQGPPPTNLLASNITTTAVDLSWTDNGCTGSVVVKYRVSSTSTWLTGSNIASSPYSLIGLTPGVDYEWRLKCNGCSGSSCWSSTEQFTTSSPQIDSAFVSQPILCYGGFASDEMQINVNQSNPSMTYSCVVGYYFNNTSYFISFYSSSQTNGNQLNFSGFNPNVDYVVRIVDSTSYFNANSFGNGTSTVGIYDEFGPINFYEPPQLVVATTQVNSNLCYGDCVAQEEIVISGGTQPYTYIFNDTNTVTLGPQLYEINTTLGNTFTPSILNINVGDTVKWINNGGSHNINGNQSTFPNNPESFGNGAATSAPWSYQWVFTVPGAYDYQCDPHANMGMVGVINVNSSPSSFTTDTLMNLCEGLYNLVISDANGCLTNPDTTIFNIDSVLPITPAYEVSLFSLPNDNISCFGGVNGFINAIDTGLGGTGLFTFSIDSVFQTSTNFSNLSAGTYPLTFKDANGCMMTETIILNEPDSLAATAFVSDSIDCYGESGEITMNYDPIYSGTPGYLYSADNINFQSSNVFLLAGDSTYNMTIEDINGCQFTVPVFLSEPTQLIIDSTVNIDITCNGYNDGIATVFSVIGGSPSLFGGFYNYLWNDPLSQTNQAAIGLSAGTYFCVVSDANGCSDTSINITIIEPPSISSNISTTSVSCFGGNNGEAEVFPSGGTPFTQGNSYVYLWDDSLSQTTQTANNLSAGAYNCTIIDSNGCSFVTPVTILESSDISVTSSRTNITCFGEIDGTATVFPNGGEPFSQGEPYLYSWDDSLGQTTQTAINLSAGTYTCTISDSLGCNVSYAVTIYEPPMISSLISQTNISCYGLVDGTATVTPSGGRPFTQGQPYTYLWNDLLAQTTQTAVDLSAGIYTCTITDSSGCFYIQDSIVVIEPNLLEIDSIHYINESCYGSNDGEILIIDVLGGVPPFEYAVNGSTPYSNTAYFNGYNAGVYTVEVFDVNNCVSARNIIITEPDELIVDITTSGWVFNNNNGLYSYQIKCHGDSSGFATLAINGGTAPFEKNLYNATTGILIESTNINVFSNLKAGEYVFQVIDANGCSYSENILFNEPNPITHNFIATHVTCNGWSNGSLTDIVTGGVGNATSYIYSWNTGDSTYTINDLDTGWYTITVTDENNCVSIDSVEINDSASLTSNIVIGQHVTCYDYCDGKIEVIPFGGLPNYDLNGAAIYTYQWNDILSQTTQEAIGLCVNNSLNSTEYSCIITDAQGCSDTISATLTQPDSLYVFARVNSDYNLQDISCYGAADGELEAFVTGGNMPYNYTWSTGFDQPNISGLVAGTYTIVVDDSKGCLDTAEVTLNEPTELTISVSQTNVNCFNVFDATITADANGGTPFPGIPPKYNYSFSSGFNQQIDISTDIDVIPGIYTVTATDINGCSVISQSIFISQPTNILSIDLDSIDESCNQNNGEAISNLTGGTQPYTYIWSNGENTSSIDNLSPGIYFLEVIDDNGCIANDTIRVVGSDEIFLPGNISSFDSTICLGSSFELNIEEKLGFNYVWKKGSKILLNKTINNLTNDNADIIVIPEDYFNAYTLTITDPTCLSTGIDSYDLEVNINVDFIDPMIITNPNIEYGNYPIVLAGESLQLSSDNSNCIEYIWTWSDDTIINNNGNIVINDLEKSDWYYLYVKNSEDCIGYDSVYVVVGVNPYEAITPNNDGFNDFWTPLDIKSYENAIVQVFNRWGSLVFESKGGENYKAWDGTNNGKELPAATYYYIIDLNTGDEPQTGPITIIR